MSKSLILKAIAEEPWAILPKKMETIIHVSTLHALGAKFSAEEIAEKIGPIKAEQEGRRKNSVGSVAVLPIVGTLSKRANMLEQSSGGASTDAIGQAFLQLVNDPKVSSIILDIDSPGGTVAGTTELSNLIFEARGKKPIIAVANSLAASAALWIATAADKFIVTPSGLVGSIGVFTVHNDISKNLEQEGIKATIISAGKKKVDGNPFEPLSDRAKKDIQAMVDDMFSEFVSTVARNRGVTAEFVIENFGQGDVMSAEAAVKVGLADSVATLRSVIKVSLATSSSRKSQSKTNSVTRDSRSHKEIIVVDAQEGHMSNSASGGGDQITESELLEGLKEYGINAESLVDVKASLKDGAKAKTELKALEDKKPVPALASSDIAKLVKINKEQASRISILEYASAKSMAVAAVGGFIREGKITTSQKDAYVELAVSNTEQFNAIMANAPVVIDIEEKGGNEAEATYGTEMTEEQAAIESKRIVDASGVNGKGATN